MPRAIRVLAIATIAFGLAVEPLGRDLGWLPDLLTGWALAACGVVVARARPQGRVGLLLAASGVLWFAGNLASSDVTLLAEAGTGARFLYRAPLVLAVLTVPEGRPASRRHATVVAAAALMAVIPAVGQSLPGALSLALLVVVAGASRPVALPGAAALALVVTGGSVITHVLAPGQAVVAVSAAYGAGLVVAAGISVLATVRAEWSPAELADALVADADSTVHAFRDALAEAVGDRSLAVGFLDAAPSASPGQEVTQIDVDGVMVAALVHRPGALRDPVLHDAVRAATRLQAANVRLQRDL
ncbi:MAG TPA: hypothetical protein VFY45_03875, partial [Baekduia sp.]|nr:hypothetical protein [Baekduia sp.]